MLHERRERAEPVTAPPQARTEQPPALTPSGLLALQRSLGNQGVGRLIARAAPAAEATTAAAWPPAEAVKAARAAGDVAAETAALRAAILAAAPNATFAQGLPEQQPKPAEVDIDLAYDAEAYTRVTEVPANPDNYWRWMHWGRNSVRESEAHTLAVITHELVHVQQFLGWWKAYDALDPATRPPWLTYIAPLSEEARGLGPQELEAHMTSLDFLPRLKPAERRTALQQLFVAFIKTGQYVPPAGVTPETTTAATAPVILDAFKAQPEIQPEYGEWFWHALRSENPDRDGWLRYLRELLPIAEAGYADAAKQPFYDSFLKRVGLTWAVVVPP
ncbi:MAG TPA: hypothetical protein VFZ00_12145 [Solirubrobacter sp.]|nr:hypothetical protein [Solirubrobacter sp.]